MNTNEWSYARDVHPTDPDAALLYGNAVSGQRLDDLARKTVFPSDDSNGTVRWQFRDLAVELDLGFIGA